MKVTVIIVAYHSADVLPRCLESIPLEAEVIIVSQDGTTGVSEVASRLRPSAKVIASGRNRGFGAGCNLGAANASSDTIVFLNPDTRLGEDCLDHLVETSTEGGGTLTGPRILDDEGHDVTRARNWSTPWTDIVDLVLPRSIQPKRWRRDFPQNDAVYHNGGVVPYIQGACMVIGRRLFIELGGFDEEFFLYGEEECLARKLAGLGYSTVLDTRATITHTQHTSLVKTGGFAVEQYFRTRALVYRRDTSLRDRGVWLGAIRSIPLVIALVLLLVTSACRKRLHYRSAEDKRWCEAALKGVIQGLMRRPVNGSDPALRDVEGTRC